jgi:hypothetical protein
VRSRCVTDDSRGPRSLCRSSGLRPCARLEADGVMRDQPRVAFFHTPGQHLILKRSVEASACHVACLAGTTSHNGWV